jgi:thymidylate synthase
VPFNIASYSLLTIMIAKILNLKPGEFIHTFGDAHLYNNHFDQAREQIQRIPKISPKIKILSSPDSIFDFQYNDFVLEDYNPHPHISAPIAV